MLSPEELKEQLEAWIEVDKVLAKMKRREPDMMTVCVFINGAPLVARSAVNQNKTNENGEHEYLIDAGVLILHKRDEEGGAIELAKKLLDTIDKRIC